MLDAIAQVIISPVSSGPYVAALHSSLMFKHSTRMPVRHRNTLTAMLIVGSIICAGCVAGNSLPSALQATQISLAPSAVLTPTVAPTAIDTATALPTATSMPTSTPVPTATPTITPAPTATPMPGPTACGEMHGAIIHRQLRSAAMGRTETYRIYTPACYRQQTNERYPVIYLLHGGEHNEEHWDNVGVDDAADTLIAEGTIPPLLIVLPDGGQNFGTLKGDPPPFAHYLHDELIPQIDAAYRTLADRDHRALGGISYGAAWALLLAARYADTFGAVGAHSPAIGTFNGIYPDVAALAAGKLRIYVDVGDHDGLRKPAAAFDVALTQASVPHEFHIFLGRHIESYWNSHLSDYLRFYTREWQR